MNRASGPALDGGASEGNGLRLAFYELSTTLLAMATFSTRDAAKQLGLDVSTLSRYIAETRASRTTESSPLRWRVESLFPPVRRGSTVDYRYSVCPALFPLFIVCCASKSHHECENGALLGSGTVSIRNGNLKLHQCPLWFSQDDQGAGTKANVPNMLSW